MQSSIRWKASLEALKTNDPSVKGCSENPWDFTLFSRVSDADFRQIRCQKSEFQLQSSGTRAVETAAASRFCVEWCPIFLESNRHSNLIEIDQSYMMDGKSNNLVYEGKLKLN